MENTTTQLPDELWLLIFSYLPSSDLRFDLKLVDTQFDALIRSPLLWEERYTILTNAMQSQHTLKNLPLADMCYLLEGSELTYFPDSALQCLLCREQPRYSAQRISPQNYIYLCLRCSSKHKYKHCKQYTIDESDVGLLSSIVIQKSIAYYLGEGDVDLGYKKMKDIRDRNEQVAKLAIDRSKMKREEWIQYLFNYLVERGTEEQNAVQIVREHAEDQCISFHKTFCVFYDRVVLGVDHDTAITKLNGEDLDDEDGSDEQEDPTVEDGSHQVMEKLTSKSILAKCRNKKLKQMEMRADYIYTVHTNKDIILESFQERLQRNPTDIDWHFFTAMIKAYLLREPLDVLFQKLDEILTHCRNFEYLDDEVQIQTNGEFTLHDSRPKKTLEFATQFVQLNKDKEAITSIIPSVIDRIRREMQLIELLHERGFHYESLHLTRRVASYLSGSYTDRTPFGNVYEVVRYIESYMNRALSVLHGTPICYPNLLSVKKPTRTNEAVREILINTSLQELNRPEFTVFSLHKRYVVEATLAKTKTSRKRKKQAPMRRSSRKRRKFSEVNPVHCEN